MNTLDREEPLKVSGFGKEQIKQLRVYLEEIEYFRKLASKQLDHLEDTLSDLTPREGEEETENQGDPTGILATALKAIKHANAKYERSEV